MSLKPYDRKISQIFDNNKYDIDFYQREYKWNDELEYKPVSSLLKDIFYRFDMEKYNPNQDITEESTDRLEWYYLNSYMTNKIKGKRYIVDGQQRLTTLTLISIGLYHLAIELKLPKYIIDTLKNSVQGNNEFGTTYWMGFNDRENALDDILINSTNFQSTPKNISEENIYKNYAVILKRLSNKFTTAHKLQTFISYFRNRIYLIEIEIDKDKDVAMVFEVINDRGVPLKPYEILKGKMLSQIDVNDRDKFIDIWDKQIQLIEEWGENEIDEFFGFYFRSKYANTAEQYRSLDKTKYHKTIFVEEYNRIIGFKEDEKKVREFVEFHFPYFVEIYTSALKYYYDYSKKNEAIYFNKINDMDGQFVLLLSAIEFNDKEKDTKFIQIPTLFDKFFVKLRLTNSYKSNEFNTSVISLNGKIRNSTSEALSTIFDNEFKNSVENSHARKDLDEPFKYEFFKNLGYNDFGKKFLRYFFARVDHYISDQSGLDPFSSYDRLVLRNNQFTDTYHIEHILTNNLKNIELFESEEEFNSERNRFGGLLLLKGKDNQSSGDELYIDKLKTYNVVGTYFAKTLLNDMYVKKVEFTNFIKNKNLNFKSYDTFSKNEIEERQQLLFDISRLIWK